MNTSDDDMPKNEWLRNFSFDFGEVVGNKTDYDPLDYNSVMEYNVIERFGGMTVQQRKDELNSMGAAGWEAFAIVDHCVYLKRTIS